MRLTCIAMATATLISLCGCYDQSAYDAALDADTKQREAAWAQAEQEQAEDKARREEAWAVSKAMLKTEEAMLKRCEALLTKQEKQAERFDAILTKWESLPTPKDH